MSTTFSPAPVSQVRNAVSSDEDNYKYYDEFKKLLHTSYCIEQQIKDFKKLKNSLEGKIHTMEVHSQSFSMIL